MQPTASDEIADSIVEDLRQRASREGLGVFNPGEASQLSALAHGGIPGQATGDTTEMSVFYEATTGEARSAPTVYLGKILRKRHPLTNKPVFVARNPDTGQPMTPVPEYQVGKLMCFLHPDHPEREKLAEMGIGLDIVCGDHLTHPAGSFRTTLDLRNHEQRRHKRSYEIRDEHRTREREEDARNEQRRQTDAILALASRDSSAAAVVSSGRAMHVCDVTDCDRFFDSAQGLAMHRSTAHNGRGS